MDQIVLVENRRDVLNNIRMLQNALDSSSSKEDQEAARKLIKKGNHFIALLTNDLKPLCFAPIRFCTYKGFASVADFCSAVQSGEQVDNKQYSDKNVIDGRAGMKILPGIFGDFDSDNSEKLKLQLDLYGQKYGLKIKKNNNRKFLIVIEENTNTGGHVLNNKLNNISEYTDVLKIKKNIILQGAPGTGKTYSTAAIALSIIDADIAKTLNLSDHAAVMQRYEEYRSKEQIFFCTFHQSMDYEDFVEGLRPEISGNGTAVTYKVKPGIFKNICTKASSDTSRNFVLIIDEINRGNVSKIFGELITLLEKDKRTDGDHPISVILPYSNESFSVPSNLYIIGTMNSTDRSTGTIDYAVRRRFDFITLEADENALDNMSETKDKAKALFRNVRAFIEDKKIADMDISDLMVGHSYFMAENENELKLKIKYEVIPLVKEYIKDGILNCLPDEANKFFNAWKELNTRDIGTGDEPVIESKE